MKVLVYATVYNAPSKDEVYADLTMITNRSTYPPDIPIYAWTLNMSNEYITTSVDPSDALDSFPNTFKATWTINDMYYINNEADKEQVLLVTLWVTNSSCNQQYVTYALAVVSTEGRASYFCSFRYLGVT